VFIDFHGNGVAQPSDPPLPAVQVFIDQNNNGQPDPNELSTFTDASGHYTFTNLPDGTYTVREVVPPGFVLTEPADDVRTGVIGLDIASGPLDFGNRPASPLLPLNGAEDLYGPRPSPDQATALVKGLYHAVLGRDADAFGLAFWTSRLAGGETRGQVVGEIWNSAEHRGEEVDAYYQAFLHRAADDFGRAFWIGQLQGGMDESTLALNFLGSSEYTQAHASNDAFVTGLYQDVLDRAPEAGGTTFWTGQLAAGASRGAVALGIMRSDEAFRRAIDSLYASYLHRSDQSPSGLGFWDAQLLGGGVTPAQAARAFLASDEFFRNAGTS
jgi:hypothetical protein